MEPRVGVGRVVHVGDCANWYGLLFSSVEAVGLTDSVSCLKSLGPTVWLQQDCFICGWYDGNKRMFVRWRMKPSDGNVTGDYIK